MKKKKKKAAGVGKRTALTVLCVVLAVVLVVLLSGTIYAEYLLGKMNYVADGDQERLSLEEIEALSAPTETIDPNFTGAVYDDYDLGDGPRTTLGDSENVINILLIGQDTRNGQRSRSDSMILCTFNKNKNTLTLTSFMRDLYVSIPGYYKTRINAAYLYGGMELLDETLEENFGIHVDGNVEVDFNQFADIIDLLGGIDVELTQKEAAYINRYTPGGASVSAGVQHLAGDEALTYARDRNDIDGDFSRTNRQRKLLSLLVDKFKDSKLTEMIGMLDDLLPMVTTDMTKSEIVGYVTDLFPMLATCEIVTQHIPVDDGYENAVIGGAQVLVPNMDKNLQALEDSLGD